MKNSGDDKVTPTEAVEIIENAILVGFDAVRCQTTNNTYISDAWRNKVLENVGRWEKTVADTFQSQKKK